MTNLTRRNDDDPSQSKNRWSFMAYALKNHPIVCIITPALLAFVIMFGIWFIMNVSYDGRHWKVTPRINVDIDLEKEMKK